MFPTSNLTTTLVCTDENLNNSTNACGYVGQPTVRGSTQLLVTFLFRMLSTAFGTLYMEASLKWWKKALDFVLRLFFPELSLWKVLKEEILRRKYLKHLHAKGYTGATSQQLMSIQQGKLFLSRLRKPVTNGAMEMEFGINIEHMTTMAEREMVSLSVKWCSEIPKEEQCSVLKIANVPAYQSMLASLPTGKQTWMGIGYPDLGTGLLTLQLTWLIVTISMRLASGFRLSILELYCLFSLVAFILERLVTQFNVPAWNQCVVIQTDLSCLPGRLDIVPEESLSSTWKSCLRVLPALQFVSWPVFMFLYGFRYDGGDGLSMTNSVCVAAGGTYLAAFFWGFIGVCVAGSSWRVLRYIPFVISCGGFGWSKLSTLGIGIAQVFVGDRGIYLMPEQQWNIPHLSG
ncbi:hypothetical protein GQ44DRAFT_765169 [Phaeosphaeriaceae sp. PMI808]|nr:hypothetical protein GQ44DRAFT_765169 [Phaeosphaeriaceae sp. PMI808]